MPKKKPKQSKDYDNGWNQGYEDGHTDGIKEERNRVLNIISMLETNDNYIRFLKAMIQNA